MKLPRDLSGADVVRALERLGFQVNRQTGSHIQLSSGSRRITVPNHCVVAPGTLKSILRQAGITVEDLASLLE
jgi:predicted RNA binding protein YcfA (HicA-like mRNA interferase family)